MPGYTIRVAGEASGLRYSDGELPDWVSHKIASHLLIDLLPSDSMAEVVEFLRDTYEWHAPRSEDRVVMKLGSSGEAFAIDFGQARTVDHFEIQLEADDSE